MTNTKKIQQGSTENTEQIKLVPGELERIFGLQSNVILQTQIILDTPITANDELELSPMEQELAMEFQERLKQKSPLSMSGVLSEAEGLWQLAA